ncbi:MAG: hypothetical protein ACI8RD_013710 [Bacillariaceae sp.]|jgi:hypothetical protein
MEIRKHRKSSQSRYSKKVILTVSLIVVVCSALVVVLFFQDSYPSYFNEVVAVDNNNNNNNNFGKSSYAASNSNSNNSNNKSNRIKNKNNNNSGLQIPVFYPKYSIPSQQGIDDNGNNEIMTSSVTVKLVEDLTNSPSVGELVALDMKNPPEFLKTCGFGGAASSNGNNNNNNPVERLEVLKQSKQPHLAMELLKYCALEHYQGGLFVDSQSTLSSTVDHILAKTMPADGGVSRRSNLAVLNDPKISPNGIHGALLYIAVYSNNESSSPTTTKSTVAEDMIQLLMSTNVRVLESSPLLLSKSLYDFIAKDMKLTQLVPGAIDPSKDKNNNHWYLFQHTCSLFSLGQRQITAPISSYALNSHRYVIV